MEKQFHIGDVLSITTGYLLSSNTDGIYRIFEFMTKDSLFYHQISRVFSECKHHLLKQHPQLNNVDTSKLTHKNCQEWLNQQVARFGEKLTVRTILDGGA